MRSVGVKLRLWTQDYRRDADEARRANERLEESGHKARKGLDDMAMGFGLVGGAMLAAAAAVVYTTAKFDKQMSEVKAVSGATVEEFAALREAALAAGAATVFSASEAAAGISELAKAGVKTSDILAGALRGALDLAAAGSLDLATAATIAANAMNTFGLSGRDVAHIADVLSAAANKSAVGVEDLGLGLQQVGLVAAQVGLSLEETVGLLAAFGDRGLRGSDGATSLKTALLRLAAPLGEAQALMDELGISLYDANGNMVDAVTIAGQLRAGLGKLSASERNAALSTIFGSDAIRAANVMYELGADGLQDYIDAVDDQGAAARVASEKLNNLAGDVKFLTGSLETLFITSGSGASGGLRFLVQELSALVGTIAKIPAPILSTGLVLTGLLGVLLLGTAGWLKFQAATARAVAMLGTATAASRATGTAIASLSVIAGRATVALGVLSLAFMAYDAIVGDAPPKLEKLTIANQRQQEAAAAAAADNIRLAGAFGDAANEANGLINAFDKATATIFGWRSAERDAEAAVDELTDALKESNGSLDVTTANGRAAAAAVDALAQNAAKAAQAKYDETGSVEAANEVWERYIAQLRALLLASGMSQEAVDALVNSIAKMPTYKAITIDVKVNRPKGVTVYGQGDLEFAQGGIHRAANGLISRPGAAITNQAITWAEAGTEAYVAKDAPRDRSLAILGEAAQWHGAQVVPAGGLTSGLTSGMAAGRQRVEVIVSPKAGATRDLVDLLRFDVVQSGGGDVQGYMGARGRLG